MLNKLKGILRLLSSQQYFSIKKQIPELKEKARTQLPIQSLSQLIKSKQMLEVPDFDKDQYQPCQLLMSVVRALKQSLYQSPDYERKILDALNKYKQDMEYAKYIVTILLPADKLFPNLNRIYVDIALKYLKNQTEFHKQELFYIVDNLMRMVVEMQSEWMDENWILQDYTKEQEVVNLLVPKLIEKKNQFDMTFFLKVVRICDTLSVNNPDLASYLIQQIQSPASRIKMSEILYSLIYLSKSQAFPYEYFYTNKSRWIKTIESYNLYSAKKSFESIKFFQVILIMNPMHCQLMIKKLQDLLLQAIPSFDNEQLANIWFLCNRAKFSMYPNLIKSLLQKMTGSVSIMQKKQLCLLVRGFMRFSSIKQYEDMCRYILNVIQQKLDPARVYQHQIIKQILGLLSKQQVEQKSI